MVARIGDGRTDLVFDSLEHHEANATDKRGVALIRWCAYYGDVSAIRYLMVQAAAFGFRESLQTQLDAGANREVQNMNGETPLAWASWRNRPASILKLHCYDAFSIHSPAIERSLTEEGQSWGGMKRHFLGQCH